jgi:AbiTii
LRRSRLADDRSARAEASARHNVCVARSHDLIAEIEQDVLDPNASIATALRKCVALGGRSGSEQLRDWATRELKGYAGIDEIPAYRVIQAPLMVDAVSGNVQITHQQFPPSGIPDWAQEHISERLELRYGAGEIEEFCKDGNGVHLQPPGASDLTRVMNAESDRPYQHIVSLYWAVAPAALRGVLDQIRTALTQLVAELRANMTGGETVPSAEAANQAVSVVVTGKRSKVSVTSAQASGGGSATVATPEADSGFWTRWRKVGAFVVGVATIGGTVFAILHG